MILRRYRSTDLDSIADLEKRAFTVGPYSRRYLKRVLEDAEAISIVAQIDSKIAGYLVALPAEGHSIDIESIATDPEFRRSGIATRMIVMLKQIACERYESIILEVREKNDDAISLYRKMGFEITEFLNGYYQESYLGSRNAYRMRLMCR
ncbi:N-terminal acetyltransferase related protein [Thermoplasma acidophilum]|uniref:N-terminal acetyltransferase related protein n=1 Tax=Thermoplasma acidophilum (strain ATCC 25905 / DSM 1728 / JCM 9062 / NBRC 15155 / AMRC-C165) TaxID=273075 RepID=Q9HJ33_THEAC|nr:N-acetyltransferase [Thermoplasma acidophilum]MCY0851872.1 N-acetyltransferase [Thermoplasma acidophilum]CAC12266.1 N-terminal acetyltransferase related protein [Thermoplasma acidophilum]